MFLRSWRPGDLEVRAEGRKVRGRVGFYEKGMISDGAGRGDNQRPLGEVFLPGSFDDSIRRASDPNDGHDVHIFTAHDSRLPLASVVAGSLKLLSGKKEMEFEAELARTTAGDDTLELIRSGVAPGVSIGFRLPAQRNSPNAVRFEREPFDVDGVRFDPEPDVPGADVRLVRDVILSEISLAVAKPVFRLNKAEARAMQEWCFEPSPRRKIWLP